MPRNWTFRDLEVFCCVARRSSFRAAADELGISPAYVTKRVAAFEAALGVPLFHRTTRRVRISAAGEAAYQWARKVLDAVNDLDANVNQTQESLVGTLRISTSMRLGRNHLVPILSLMAREYPALDIWLELVDRRVDLIAEGFDIDVRVGQVEEPHLIAHRICGSDRILCASPAYLERRGSPRTLSDMTNHDCLMFRDRGQPFGILRMEGPHGSESVNVSSRMGSNHSDPAAHWVTQGHGIALLAGWDVASILKDGTVVRVLPDYRQVAHIHAVMSARTSHSAKLRTCVDFIERNLQDGPYALDLSVT